MNQSTQEPLLLQRSGGKIMEIIIGLAVLAVWIVLQAWVLPRFGVKT
jgi:type IV secretory pathway TrbD component